MLPPQAEDIRGEMVYKIFSEIVEYPEAYRGIKEITMDGRTNEAVAKVKFRKTPSDATFTCDPCWIDNIAQVPGFVLNGSTSTLPDLVFLSTGWESLRIAKSLSDEKEYTCYVRMQTEGSPGLLLGDVFLFEDTTIVAVATGLKFHEVNKNILHKVLPGSRNLSDQAITSDTELRQTNPTAHNAASSRTIKVTSKPKQHRVSSGEEGWTYEGPELFPSVLQLIAQEVGVGLRDLSDDAILEDLGIDSLLAIAIGTKVKDALQLDLPVSLFSQCETVAQLREYFQESSMDFTGTPTSSDDISTGGDSPADTNTTSETSPSEDSFGNSSKEDIVDIILAAIVKESGIQLDEMDPDAEFTDLGVDSLMTIAILGAITAETGEQLAASTFSDYPTISALEKGLRKPSVTSNQVHPLPEPAPLVVPKALATSRFRTEDYSSNVVLLQGDTRSTSPPLVLIADGAGSAASYLHFPQMPSRLPIYALESPFLNRPSEYTCTIEEICTVFVASIRSTRPRGPYFLGGWSIGGIYAYETARQLVQLGERVEGVLLIESPCPKKMEGLPPLTLEVLEETGIFVGIPTRGGGPDTPMPLGQKQHIVGCVQAVITYDPLPLEPEQRPAHTYIIWSERGLFEQLSEKVKEASDPDLRPGIEKPGINRDWLVGKRTSFGPKGWNRLLGDCECHSTEGDHFSCMNLPRVSQLESTAHEVADKYNCR